MRESQKIGTLIHREESYDKMIIGNANYEIGSYFWLDPYGKTELKKNSGGWLPQVTDSCLTFSGRSAIELALLDIIKERGARTAYLPSYCCESMVTPFIKNGIHVDFYDVDFQDGFFTYRVDNKAKHDVALVMSYFGLSINNANSLIDNLSKQETVIIEDITHSLLRNTQSSSKSDYLIAALRKWFAIPTGGWIGKRKGQLIIRPNKDSEAFVKEKVKGMHDKACYVSGEKIDKRAFLELQNGFEVFLDSHDCMLMIDAKSKSIIENLTIDEVCQTRRNNAEILYSGIQSLNDNWIQLPAMDLTNDTPLFLPVFMEHEHRDSLRKHLISKSIYCPVHWPDVKGVPSGIRNNELSIICDQRYGTDDMVYIIDTIRNWVNDHISTRIR